MARKDVNLVIRARDEASSALKRVNASLDDFRKSQAEVGGDAGKTDKALKNLTAALKQVEAAFGGMDAASAAGEKMQRAARGLAALQKESADTAQRLSATRKELRDTKRALSGYENTLSNLSAKLAATRDAQVAANKAQVAATSSAKTAQASMDKLVARQAELPGLIEKQNAALSEQRDRWAGLKAQMEAGSPTKRVQQNFVATTKRVSKLSEGLQGLETEFAGIGAKIDKAGKQVRDFTRDADRSEKEFDKHGATLERTGQKYAELKDRIARTQVAIRGLTSARGQGERGLENIALDIDRANAALAELEGFARDADAALDTLRGSAAAGLEEQLTDQALAARRARDEFRSLQRVVAEGEQTIRQTEAPTQAMVDTLERLRDRLRLSELAMLTQDDALAQMQTAYRRNGQELLGLLQTQQQFAAFQSQVEQSMRDLGKEALQSAKAIRDAQATARDQQVVSTDKAVREQQQLQAALKQVEQQYVEQGLAVSKARQSYRDVSADAAKLANQIGKVGVPTRQMSEDLAQAQIEAERTGQRLEYTESAFRDAGRVMRLFNAGTIDSATALKGFAASQQALSRELNKIDAEAGQAADAIARLHRVTADSNAAPRELTKEAAIARKALADLRGEAEKQLAEQGLQASRTRDRLADLREEYARLVTEVSRVGVPTAELSERFNRLRVEVEANELALLEQEQAARRMGKAFNAAEQDVAGLTKLNAIFANIQTGSKTALDTIQREAREAAQEIERLHAAANKRNRLASELRDQGKAAQQTTRKISTLRQAYNDLYGGSRQALSINQRLRGEVLSLIATYGGFYAVISTLRQVVAAYQEIEAATARLNVANNGNIAATAEDLDYLRRTADRLGVDLGTLSREYSKFMIAAQGTNLQGARARRIFEAVTEAARVSRTSTEELKGVFTALVQIVSKGAVQMEELRQQLGDRLPGALQIMADGLGVTTGELIKLMENGQVSSDALVGFAEELERRFGAGLPDALQSTSAELGRLQNAAFQAMLAFGNAGFIESFTTLVRKLTATLKSAEFKSFIERLSAGFGVLLDTIGVVVDNIQLFGTVIGAALGLKSLRLVNTLIGGFGNMRQSVRDNIAEYRKWQRVQAVQSTAMAGQIGVVGRMTRSVKGLTLALRAMASSTLLGVGLTIGGAVLANWLTSATSVNEAMERHVDIMDKVRNAYEGTEGSIEKWRESLKGVLSEQELYDNLKALETQVDESLDRINDAFQRGGRTAGQQLLPLRGLVGADFAFRASVEALVEQLNDGQIGIAEFRAELESLSKTYRGTSDANDRFASEIAAAARKYEEVEKATEEARLAVATFGEDSEEAKKALDKLARATNDADGELEAITKSGDAAAKALEDFRERADRVRDGLRGMLREFPRFQQYLDDIEKAEAFEEMALDVLRASGEILDLKRTWLELQSTVAGTSFTGLFVDLLTDLDSIQSKLNGIGDSLGGLVGRFGELGGVLSGAVGGVGNFLSTALGNFSPNDSAAMEDAVNRLIFIESRARPDAAAQDNAPPGVTATAFGLGQFIADTWLAEFKRRFPEEAARMSNEQILALRADPALNYQMTMATAQDAARRLERQGIPVNPTSIYLEHFMGQGGAAKLLSAPQGARYGDQFPREARSNPAFADMTVGEVVAEFTRRLRAVTPAQVAMAQRYNPSPVGEQADIPGFVERAEDRAEALDDQAFEIRQQELITQGLERQAAVEQAIREARQNHPYADDAYYERVGENAAKLFDLEEKRRQSEEAATAREATNATLSDAEFAIQQQELINAGKERQAEIEAALRDARKADPEISQQELQLLAARTGALHDLKIAQSGQTQELKAAEKAQEAVNNLLAERNALEERLGLMVDRGDASGAAKVQQEIESLNTELLAAITNAQALWRAVGTGEAAVAVETLENAKIEAAGFAKQGFWAQVNWTGVYAMLEGGLSTAFSNFAQAVAQGEDAFEAARTAFLKFASDFLIQIGQMIVQQMILRAMQAAFGGSPFGLAIGIPTAHSGGEIGQNSAGSGGNLRRWVNPAVFAGASRFHSGGVVGLRPGEVPIIAKQGEEMLTRDDPRHVANGGGGGGAGGRQPIKIVNTFDASEMLNHALSTPEGDELFLNYVRANAPRIKAVLG